MWYDQTVEQRATAMRWYAARGRDGLSAMLAANQRFPETYADFQIEHFSKQIDRLEALSLELRDTMIEDREHYDGLLDFALDLERISAHARQVLDLTAAEIP